MKLLKHVNNNTIKLQEDAAGGAVSAGGVAGFAMPLFSTIVKRVSPTVKVLKWGKKKKKKNGQSLGLSEAYHTLAEDFQDDTGMSSSSNNTQDTSFDTSEVMAKLKGLENRDKQDHRDTVTFGLEDENGDLVRVTVRQDQAEDFEHSLQGAMAEKSNEGELPEIAELLFKMKDQYDIVDIEWPEVAEDEEQELSLEPGAEGGGQGAPGAGGPEGEMGAPPEGEMGEMPPETGGDTGQVTDLLTQVIDMMKSEAEARKAEAKAREAEAKTKEADALVSQAMTKVKQEEQFLDMDSYNKAKKEEEREAKRLAQLAKWKHDMEKDEGITDEFGEEDMANLVPEPRRGERRGGAPEEEERAGRLHRPSAVKPQQPKKGSTIKGRVNPYDVASFILSRVK